MSRAVQVQVMYYLCVIILVIGVYLEFGLGWAAMVGGTIGAISFLALADTDEKSEERRQ